MVLSPDSGPAHVVSAVGTPVIGLHAATPSRRSGPYSSFKLCVDRYDEAVRKFRHKEQDELRWGQWIEHPGVMELIQVDDLLDKLESAMGR